MRSWAVWLALLSLGVASGDKSDGRMNVLMLVSDDLRPEIGAFGPDGTGLLAHTPHLDKLAADALVLAANFVNQAVCGPVSSMPPPHTHALATCTSEPSQHRVGGRRRWSHLFYPPLRGLFSPARSVAHPDGQTRASFMTGRRPDTLHTVTHVHPTYWRERAGPFWSLPQHFKEAGYYTSRYRWTPGLC